MTPLISFLIFSVLALSSAARADKISILGDRRAGTDGVYLKVTNLKQDPRDIYEVPLRKGGITRFAVYTCDIVEMIGAIGYSEESFEKHLKKRKMKLEFIVPIQGFHKKQVITLLTGKPKNMTIFVKPHYALNDVVYGGLVEYGQKHDRNLVNRIAANEFVWK